MSGELKMENGELKTADDMRDALLYAATAANEALYTHYPNAEAAAKAYADAIDLIRKSVCPPDTFFRPVGLLPELPPTPAPGAKGKKDRQVTCVKLPLLAVSKELGSPRQDGTRAVYGVSCVSDGEGHAEVKLFVDGVRVGTASLDVGHTTAWAIAKQMKYYLISRKEKAMRHRANVRARREGGAV